MGKRGAIYTEFCYDLTDNSLLPGGQDQRARTATRPDAVHRVRPGPTPTRFRRRSRPVRPVLHSVTRQRADTATYRTIDRQTASQADPRQSESPRTISAEAAYAARALAYR